MNTALWILQGILGLKLLTAAYTHGLRHTNPGIRHGNDAMVLPAKAVLIASSVLMLAGVLGLLGPMVPGVPPWAAPVAACG